MSDLLEHDVVTRTFAVTRRDVFALREGEATLWAAAQRAIARLPSRETA